MLMLLVATFSLQMPGLISTVPLPIIMSLMLYMSLSSSVDGTLDPFESSLPRDLAVPLV
jgi:hypothetical protein